MMSLFDKLIVGAKNLLTRSVDLRNHPNGFELSIVEYGRERTRVLTYEDVIKLQESLWNKKAVANGIAINFPPNPYETYQRFIIPSWAMERLRDDMINQRIHLNVF